MKLKNSALDIPSDDIFKHDKLSRSESVDNIKRLLENVSSPLVFSVNAPWGAGKTTYMKMLNAQLSNAGHKTLYFSAWETDFAIDPLLAFIGEMNAGLSGFLTDSPKKRKAWNKAKEIGAHILRRGIPVSVKLATFGVVDADKVFEEESAKLTETLSKDVVETYSKDKNAIAEFKKSVGEAVGGGAHDEKVYLFVDELDRCRPTYAIELLERIKHLLDIEGLVFVLALDKMQLAHSVKAVYGADFDALGYLKRFIDIEFSLPSTDTERFIKHLLTHLELDQYFAKRATGDKLYDEEHLIGALKAVSSQMSLRNIEQVVSKIKLISLTMPGTEVFFPEFVVFLLLVKDRYPAVYNDFSKQDVDGSEMLALSEVVFPDFDESTLNARQFVEALIVSGKMHAAKQWAAKHIEKLKEIANFGEPEEKYPGNAERILELIEYYSRGGRRLSLNSIFSRIDLISNFNFK